MTSRDFAYWLQGFFEINNPSTIGQNQTEIIKRHLDLVFAHEIDPSAGDKEDQDKLNAIHSPLGIDHPDYKIKPEGWDTSWKWDTGYKCWYDPKEGKLRC